MALFVATLDKEKKISFSVNVGSEISVKDDRICQNIDKRKDLNHRDTDTEKN
jgi:hypothetical protein